MGGFVYVAFTWLGSCSILAHHYLFLYLKAFVFGYFQEDETDGKSMAVECFKYARHSILPTFGPTMVGPGKQIVKLTIFRWLEDAILMMISANTVNTS